MLRVIKINVSIEEVENNPYGQNTREKIRTTKEIKRDLSVKELKALTKDMVSEALSEVTSEINTLVDEPAKAE